MVEIRIKKKIENSTYKEKVNNRRKIDPQYDELIRKTERLRKQKFRNKQKRKQLETVSHTEQKVGHKKKTSRKVLAENRKRKRAERSKTSLPKESGEWANTMNHLMKTATPKRKSMLKYPEKGNEELNNLFCINRRGRLKKLHEAVKRKLAFSSLSEQVWTDKRALKQYHKRKADQSKRVSKATVFISSWKGKIETYLNDNSRVMPNKKDTILIDGVPVAKRHLQDSKLQLYKKFKTLHPSFNRRFVTFLKLIPKNYRNLNMTCRRVRICTKDYNLDKKIEAINNLASRNGKSDIRTNARSLSNITVCPFEDRPIRLCIDRKCEKCGIDNVKQLFGPLIDKCKEEKVKYTQWEQIEDKYTTKEGTNKMSKRWVQKENSTTAEDLVHLITKDVETFTGHLFRSDYQHMCENQLMSDDLPLDHCVVVMDFSENISLQPQDEIESAHWTTKQVTLHPIFIVRHAPDSSENEPKLMKESLIIISDSLAHNSESVFVFTSKLIAHLRNNPAPCDIKTIHRYSDNCAVQYKCKDAFSHLEETYGVKVFYHYTESGHGKGQSDGLGAAVKMRLQRLILGEKRVINNAYQVYLALIQTQNPASSQKVLYVPEKVIKKGKPKKLDAKTLKGTQSYHMVSSSDQYGVLKCSDLSCSCRVCIDNQEGPCFFLQFRHQQVKHDLFTGKLVPVESAMTNNGGVDQNNTNQNYEDTIDQSRQYHAQHVAQAERSLFDFASYIARQGSKIRGETPADGNCCFWAVSDQLDHLGLGQMRHTELRQKVLDFIRNLPEVKRTEMEGFLTTTLDTYLNYMSRNGTYADHVILQALSSMLNVHINIVHAAIEDKIILHPIKPVSRSSNTAITVGVLPEVQHYFSLDRIQPQDFVAVVLSNNRRKQLYIAKVLQVDVDDVELVFMKQSSTKGIYTWPEKDDMSWQPVKDIVMTLKSPHLLSGRGIKLKFDEDLCHTMSC